MIIQVGISYIYLTVFLKKYIFLNNVNSFWNALGLDLLKMWKYETLFCHFIKKITNHKKLKYWKFRMYILFTNKNGKFFTHMKELINQVVLKLISKICNI